MSARDEFPNLAILAGNTYAHGDRNEPAEALDLIDKLHREVVEWRRLAETGRPQVIDVNRACGAPTDDGFGEPVPCTNSLPCAVHPHQHWWVDANDPRD